MKRAHEVSREEVLFRTEQAFRLCPRMTPGMLQSFLTSRVTNAQRERALKTLLDKGVLSRQIVEISSFRGRSVQVTLLSWVGVKSLVEVVRDGGLGSSAGEGAGYPKNT